MKTVFRYLVYSVLRKICSSQKGHSFSAPSVLSDKNCVELRAFWCGTQGGLVLKWEGFWCETEGCIELRGFWCGNDGLEVRAFWCGTEGFLCWTEGFSLLNWGISGAETVWSLCGTDVLNWGVCVELRGTLHNLYSFKSIVPQHFKSKYFTCNHKSIIFSR